MKKTVKWPLAASLFLLGAAVIVFPHYRGQAMQRISTETAQKFMEDYSEASSAAGTVQENYFTELRQEMEQYNEALFASGQEQIEDPGAFWSPDIELADYGIEDGVVGVIHIPAISVHLPLLLGAAPERLSLGACVLGETSMPVGGENTNCVIAGHRGWNSADFFRHLDKLQTGDTVQLTNLWETLAYRVTEIRIITPTDSDSILIRPGRDMLTLLTCHPYASGGKQRLVVYCERIGTAESKEKP